jgi:arginase
MGARRVDVISLIGAASGWGAGCRETERAPDSLRAMGLDRWLRDAGICAEWAATVASERSSRDTPGPSTEEVFALVARHGRALSAVVLRELRRGHLPVVIGGDHSVAMGTWGGVSRALGRMPIGLIWIDAHLDAHTPATTPSMNPHGMPAAALLGHGSEAFLDYAGGAVCPEHLCYLGARSYESGELALLRRLGVRILFMEDVRRVGFCAALEEALAIASAAPGGFGVTVDLDAFDPAEVPGVGLRVPFGLRKDEVRAGLSRLNGRRSGLRALEIVEYVPSLDDPERRTARLLGTVLQAALGAEEACPRDNKFSAVSR